MRFTLPRDLYHGKDAIEALKTLTGKKAFVVVGGGSMKILVDGGIRNGIDIFKALALGADGVLIARPFVTAVYGGAEEGVRELVNRLGSQLKDTMAMCGAHSLAEITRNMVRND